MKTARFQAISRCAIVLVIVSWLVATNHCAFGLMTRNTQAHCPACKPVKGAAMECCKAINGLVYSTLLKLPPVSSAGRLVAWDDAVVPARGAVLTQTILERGPPGGSPLIESVLKRSAQSHAPPELA